MRKLLMNGRFFFKPETLSAFVTFPLATIVTGDNVRAQAFRVSTRFSTDGTCRSCFCAALRPSIDRNLFVFIVSSKRTSTTVGLGSMFGRLGIETKSFSANVALENAMFVSRAHVKVHVILAEMFFANGTLYLVVSHGLIGHIARALL